MRRPALAATATAVALLLPLVACDDDADPPADDGVTQYVALGDSHTAAPHTPEDDLTKPCFRSDDNYPNVLADLLPRVELIDVSCSGATTAAMAGEQESSGTTVRPQLDALSEDTDLVTVNIGGNDEGLSLSWFGCYELTDSDPDGAPCEDSFDTGDGNALLEMIPTIQDNLDEVLAEVTDRAPNATVVVVTYPRVFPDRGSCRFAEAFAVGDRSFINTILETLGEAMIESAKDAGVKWVDVFRASRGHDICADEPWVNGDGQDQTRANVLHPFPEEQAAVAELVKGVL